MGPLSRGEASRLRLLDAARDELVETGGLEVASVARRAGASSGLPYRYFGTRSGLLIVVVEDFYARLGDACALRSYDGPTWAAREQVRVHDWVHFLHGDPLAAVVLSRLVGDADVAAAHTRQLRGLVRLGAANIAQGQSDGDLPPGRDPELLAAATLGGLHALADVALARNPRPPAQPVVAEAWAVVAGIVGLPAAPEHRRGARHGTDGRS